MSKLFIKSELTESTIKKEEEGYFISPLLSEDIDIEIADEKNHDSFESDSNSPKLIVNFKTEPEEDSTIKTESYCIEEEVKIEWNTPEVVIRQKTGKEGIEVDSSSNLFACDMCSYKFYSRQRLVRHINVNHKKHLNLSCKLCDYRYSKKHDIKKHLRKVHKLRSEPTTLSCPWCDKTFNRAELFKKHVRSFGLPPLDCQVCPRQFEYGCLLVLHGKEHMKINSYSCSKCSYKTLTEDGILKHEQKHLLASK